MFGLRNTAVNRIIDPSIALIERQSETRREVNEGSRMRQRRSIVLANSVISVNRKSQEVDWTWGAKRPKTLGMDHEKSATLLDTPSSTKGYQSFDAAHD